MTARHNPLTRKRYPRFHLHPRVFKLTAGTIRPSHGGRIVSQLFFQLRIRCPIIINGPIATPMPRPHCRHKSQLWLRNQSLTTVRFPLLHFHPRVKLHPFTTPRSHHYHPLWPLSQLNRLPTYRNRPSHHLATFLSHQHRLVTRHM